MADTKRLTASERESLLRMNGEEMMDRLPRMKDTLTAEDLNTEACVALASAVLLGLARDLLTAHHRAMEAPTQENLEHLRAVKAIYRSDYFAALSCGLVDGDAAMREIIRADRPPRKGEWLRHD